MCFFNWAFDQLSQYVLVLLTTIPIIRNNGYQKYGQQPIEAIIREDSYGEKEKAMKEELGEKLPKTSQRAFLAVIGAAFIHTAT